MKGGVKTVYLISVFGSGDWGLLKTIFQNFHIKERILSKYEGRGCRRRDQDFGDVAYRFFLSTLVHPFSFFRSGCDRRKGRWYYINLVIRGVEMKRTRRSPSFLRQITLWSEPVEVQLKLISDDLCILGREERK